MSGWTEWAANLAAQFRKYRRPPGVYAMLSDEEMSFLEQYARYSYTGAGKIVDLGPWLGASTLALARGLAESAHHQEQAIESFDLFTWEDWMTPIAQALGVPKAHASGDDFFDDTQTLLRPYGHLMRLRRQDLVEQRAFREPIEFLFIDAMKSWPLANAIARAFFPKLLPQRALVVQQDFGHYHPIGATMHVLMWRLRDALQPVLSVPNSTSAVFFVAQPIARPGLTRLDPAKVEPEEVDQAWEYSLRCIGQERWPSVLLCKVLFMVEQGWEEAAHAEAARLAAQGYRYQGGALATAQSTIEGRRGQVRRGPRVRLLEETAALLG